MGGDMGGVMGGHEMPGDMPGMGGPGGMPGGDGHMDAPAPLESGPIHDPFMDATMMGMNGSNFSNASNGTDMPPMGPDMGPGGMGPDMSMGPGPDMGPGAMGPGSMPPMGPGGPGGMGGEDGTPGVGGNPPTLGPEGPGAMGPPTGGAPGPDMGGADMGPGGPGGMGPGSMPPTPAPTDDPAAMLASGPATGGDGSDGTPGVGGNPPTLGPVTAFAKTSIKGGDDVCPPGLDCDENGDPTAPPNAEACAWFMGKCKDSKGDDQGMRHCLHACSRGPGSCAAFRGETQLALTGKEGTGIVDGACKDVMRQWRDAMKARGGPGGFLMW